MAMSVLTENASLWVKNAKTFFIHKAPFWHRENLK